MIEGYSFTAHRNYETRLSRGTGKVPASSSCLATNGRLMRETVRSSVGRARRERALNVQIIRVPSRASPLRWRVELITFAESKQSSVFPQILNV